MLKAKALAGGNTYKMNLNIGSVYRGLAHRQKNAQLYVMALNYYQEAEKLHGQLPGNSGKIEVKYNTATTGTFLKSIFVYSTAANSPVKLQVKGRVVAGEEQISNN